MKKVLTYLLAVVLGVACCFTFVGCGDDEAATRHVYREIEIGSTLTTEQLVEKAKTESGNFVAYGNTSRITTAMKNFIDSEYGKALGLTSSNAMAQKQDDSAIYTLLENEASNPGGSNNASMVLIQDSASLIAHRNDSSNLLANYVPYGMQAFVDQNNLLPFAHQFINKLFMYNTSGETNLKFDNVWTLTKAEYKDKIYFKSPKNEQVNLNFLIMLTSDEWSAKLETAYKKANNNQAATDVGESKTYKNYGYKWVAEFLKNCNFSINSDTTIAQDLSKESNAGKMGLFVLSKLRDASVKGDNLQVSAWDKENPEDTEFVTIEPFAGFMYSIYAQLCNNGPRPYTAMLFVNYLMTEEGFDPWKSLGGYSSNVEIPVYSGKITTPVYFDKEETKQIFLDNNKKEMIQDGKDDKGNKIYKYIEDGQITDKTIKEGDKITVDGKETDFKAKGKTKDVETVKDSELSFWQQTLVVEDGEYINKVKASVLDWINMQLQ